MFQSNLYISFANNLIFDNGFRSLFYLRIGGYHPILEALYKPSQAIDFEHNTHIGGGMVLPHPFCIVINGAAVIGKNCTILHGVTIGIGSNGIPTIGDNVYIGCGATIIGDVHIGNNCKIGANAVVLKDVPDNCTAVGNPARIIYK